MTTSCPRERLSIGQQLALRPAASHLQGHAVRPIRDGVEVRDLLVSAVSPAAVAAWIGAAYWFTSSTSFANPAVTIARMFSDTFAGIAPASVPLFVVFQIIGAAPGAGLALLLYPDTATAADDVVVPRTDDGVTAERNIR